LHPANRTAHNLSFTPDTIGGNIPPPYDRAPQGAAQIQAGRKEGETSMANLLFSPQGRVNRAKFWLVALGIFVIEVVLFAVLGGGAVMSGDPERALDALGPIAGIVIFVFGVIATWVSIVVGMKRFHDRNKSGWWILIIFVPVIGGLWYLIECGFLKGTSGPNNYGPDPLMAA
jgi:uncharacterized membrane protein YhaH (DUF805 family)